MYVWELKEKNCSFTRLEWCIMKNHAAAYNMPERMKTMQPPTLMTMKGDKTKPEQMELLEFHLDNVYRKIQDMIRSIFRPRRRQYKMKRTILVTVRSPKSVKLRVAAIHYILI